MRRAIVTQFKLGFCVSKHKRRLVANVSCELGLLRPWNRRVRVSKPGFVSRDFDAPAIAPDLWGQIWEFTLRRDDD